MYIATRIIQNQSDCCFICLRDRFRSVDNTDCIIFLYDIDKNIELKVNGKIFLKKYKKFTIGYNKSFAVYVGGITLNYSNMLHRMTLFEYKLSTCLDLVSTELFDVPIGKSKAYGVGMFDKDCLFNYNMHDIFIANIFDFIRYFYNQADLVKLDGNMLIVNTLSTYDSRFDIIKGTTFKFKVINIAAFTKLLLMS